MIERDVDVQMLEGAKFPHNDVKQKTASNFLKMVWAIFLQLYPDT